MRYIIGERFNVPNDKYSRLGIIQGTYSIRNIRIDHASKHVVYNFTNGKSVSFPTVAEAEAIFDRIKGVVHSPTPLIEEDTIPDGV